MNQQVAKSVHSDPSPKSAGHASTNALYALPDILSRGKFSKSHLYNLVARGHFPQPVLRMGPRFTRWGSKDVDCWFESPSDWVAAHAPAAHGVAA
jgi:predicted DNA-binding transcriptional regulator AlpA